MKYLLGNGLHRLLDNIHRSRQQKELRRIRTAELLHTVETVVDNTDSKIRLVSGYRKKLQDIIEDSLDYCNNLVDQIPASIEISSRAFSSNPYVNAFFTNINELQSIFSHSSEIRDYMESVHDSNSCCALLCMNRQEKTVLGMELAGEILKKDVLKTAVSFSDHRIYSPAPSENETRAGLKSCLFQGLTTNALDRISKLRIESMHLQSRYQMLHARLRQYTIKMSETEQGSREAVEIAHCIEETRKEIGAIEAAMMDTPLVTPQTTLEQVTDVFSKPEQFVRFRKLTLRLNKMGMVIGEDSTQPDNTLDLTEAIIGNEPPRVVTLARFPRGELLPRQVFSING